MVKTPDLQLTGKKQRSLDWRDPLISFNHIDFVV